jgi:pyoverdine/dityrosine biosynthesis protein Dit1
LYVNVSSVEPGQKLFIFSDGHTPGEKIKRSTFSG